MSVVLWLVACGTEVPSLPPPSAVPEAPRAEKGREKPDRQLGFDGMGDVHFGMDRGEVEGAMGHPLYGDSAEGCHVLTPKPTGEKSAVSLMFEEGRLRRIDVSGPAVVADGGGHVGMSADEIRALYPALVEMPHKYVEGALYLIVKPAAVGDAEIVFETNAAGRVSTLRAGLTPQVEYVEGCS